MNDPKLPKAVFGLMLFAMAIVLMATPLYKFAINDLTWLPALFMLFGGLALGAATTMEKRNQTALHACMYLLLSIVMFANKMFLDPAFFLTLAMAEGAFAVLNGLKLKKANDTLWAPVAGVGALTILLGFIAALVVNEKYYAGKGFDAKMIFEGVVLMLAGIANILPAVNSLSNTKVSITINK